MKLKLFCLLSCLYMVPVKASQILVATAQEIPLHARRDLSSQLHKQVTNTLEAMKSGMGDRPKKFIKKSLEKIFTDGEIKSDLVSVYRRIEKRPVKINFQHEPQKYIIHMGAYKLIIKVKNLDKGHFVFNDQLIVLPQFENRPADLIFKMASILEAPQYAWIPPAEGEDEDPVSAMMASATVAIILYQFKKQEYKNGN